MAMPTEPIPTVPTPPPGDGTDMKKWWWIIGGVFAAALLIGGLVVLLTRDEGDNSVTTPTNPPSTSTSTSTSEPSTTTTAPPPPGAPTITAFTAAPSPVTCSGPTAAFTLAWTTQEATGVTIETDGVPQTTPPFPATGSTPVTFNCSNPQHNYTLVATSPGGQQTRQQLTVQSVVPPTTPPTKPPVTTTTEAPTTTTTTNPVETPAVVTIDDQGNETDPMTLVVAPTSVDAGPVEFTVKNAGQQPHAFVVVQTDLPYDQLPVDPDTNKVIYSAQVVKVAKIPKFGPGKTKQLTVTLPAGNYVLIDNLPGNYALGARAPFVVTAAPPDE